MAGKGNISFVKNDEPSFIKAFKQKIGYKEGPTVDSKHQELQYEEDDRPETDEEKPVVVVLRDGDLTAEEAEQVQKEQEGTDKNPDDVSDGGKIKFKKPSKRPSDSHSDLSVSTVKKSKNEDQKKQSKSLKVKNSSLLSFDDDEEEDT